MTGAERCGFAGIDDDAIAFPDILRITENRSLKVTDSVVSRPARELQGLFRRRLAQLDKGLSREKPTCFRRDHSFGHGPVVRKAGHDHITVAGAIGDRGRLRCTGIDGGPAPFGSPVPDADGHILPQECVSQGRAHQPHADDHGAHVGPSPPSIGLNSEWDPPPELPRDANTSDVGGGRLLSGTGQ